MDMESTVVAQDPSVLGKRKWSPDHTLTEPIPGLSHDDTADARSSPPLDAETGVSGVINKKLRLPPRPHASAQENLHSGSPGPLTSLNDFPPEIIQYILSFVDPFSLGRLLRVNKLFQALLDPSMSLPVRTDSIKHLSLRSQDAVWSLSRRRSVPNMPRPLGGEDEYTTIKLVFGKTCQFCRRLPSGNRGTSLSLWEKGPGNDSVRVIWPFKIRSCISCLRNRMQSDKDLLFSNASPLMSRLPFAIFTSSFDFISPALLRRSSLPSGMELNKYFYMPQIESLQLELQDSKGLGPAAAEEWFKGLESRLREHMADVARFEEWESSGGLESAQRTFGRASRLLSNVSPNTADSQPGLSGTLPKRSPEVSGLPTQVGLHESLRHWTQTGTGQLPYMPMYHAGSAPGQDIMRGITAPSSDSASQGSQRGSRSQRPPKSIRDATKLKAERRYEIEKRCRGLDPPIYPDMLERLDAFVAAIQIPMVLNENAWETLKSRLIAQRREAEVRDESREARTRPPTPGQFRPQDQTDEYWVHHAQKQTRDKIREYAEEYIGHRWLHGTLVTYANAPQFAAEVLQHVRSRYYEVQALERNAQNRHHLGDTIPPQSDLEDRILTLEHMKWVFDQNIKPRTDLIRKDLFLCNECNINGNRHFGFDSVIQHYASKHTSDLSRGQAVVYWKAEWPLKPPFDPHPEAANGGPLNHGQTPTLPSKPLSNTSPRSMKTPLAPSFGRHSPGTMSLLSDHTGTVMSKQTYSQRLNIAPTVPGVGIYHFQREEVAEETARAWDDIVKLDDVPDNLRAYMMIQQVLQSFARRYKNEPSLLLFQDCIRTKSILQSVHNLHGLRCQGCVLTHVPEPTHQTHSKRFFTLGELLDHFQRTHLEQSYSSTRLNWRYDMIQLPSATVIRNLEARNNFDDDMRALLKDALVTVLSNVAPDSPYQQEEVEPANTSAGPFQRLQTTDASSFRRTSQDREFPRNPNENLPVGTLHHSHSLDSVGTHSLNSVRTHSVHNSPKKDDNRSITHTHGEPDIELLPPTQPHRASNERSPFIGIRGPVRSELSLSRQVSARSSRFLMEENTNYVSHSPRGSISMARDDGNRSQAASGRGSIYENSVHGSNLAEKFLADFEDLADVAMERASTQAGSMKRESRPRSSNNHHFDAPQNYRSNGLESTAPVRRRAMNSNDPLGAMMDEPMLRQPPLDDTDQLMTYEENPGVRDRSMSPRNEIPMPPPRYVEYDQRGLPIETPESRYRDWSPLQYARPGRYVDEFGRRIEMSPPTYGVMRYRPHYIDEGGRPIESGYGPGPPTEYVRRQLPPHAVQEAFYDHATGRYYRVRPAVREYIELDDPYRERAPPAVYRERPAERAIHQEELMYDRFPPDTYDDRYITRR